MIHKVFHVYLRFTHLKTSRRKRNYHALFADALKSLLVTLAHSSKFVDKPLKDCWNPNIPESPNKLRTEASGQFSFSKGTLFRFAHSPVSRVPSSFAGACSLGLSWYRAQAAADLPAN